MATVQRCFRNWDVVYNIIDHIDSSQPYYAEHDDTGARNSLAALAQTSKELFLEACLNTLWKHLPALGPLLHCLYETDEPLQPGEYGPRPSPTRFREPQNLVIKNWDRFDFYAQRIQYLWTDDDDDVSEAIFFDLARAGRALPLLRRLRNLTWYHSDRTKFLYLRLFGGPSLEEITIYPGLRTDPWPRDRSALYCALASLEATSPHLKKLRIVRDRLMELATIDNEMQDEASCLVETSPSLESFTCASSLTSPAFKQLASMTTLHSLTIHGVSDTSFLQSNDKPFFPFLQELSISAASLAVVNAFIALLGSRALRAVAISTEGGSCPNVDLVTAFFHRLDATCDPDTLTRLSFHTCPYNDPDSCTRIHDDERAIDHNCIAWLKRHSHLKELSIVSCAIAWDDTALQSLAPAWPDLRVAEIGSSSMHSTFTISTLEALAQYCPSLRAIWLDIQFDNINEADPALPAGTTSQPASGRRPKLKIAIGQSHLDGDCSERTIAVILKRIFPNISAVSSRRVEFWIRMEWPKYRSMTEQDYLQLPADDLFDELFIKFPWPDDSLDW